jgi:drug/metabolite transporter (DMT)-like permease
MKIFSIALLSILLSAAAQFLLKLGVTQIPPTSRWLVDGNLLKSFLQVTNRYIFLGLLVYGVGAVIWLFVLSKWDVSKAYPLVGFGFIFTAIAGSLMGEDISLIRAVGIAFICVGVALISRT